MEILGGRVGFWRCVVAAKYGILGAGLSTLEVRRPHWCSLWKGTRAGWDKFSNFISIKVGDGRKIDFGSLHGVVIGH